MLRPFQLRDWGTVHRLKDYSIPCNAAHHLIESTHPLQGVLFRFLRQSRATYTFVEDGPYRGLAQVRLNAERANAALLLLGAEPPSSPHEAVNETLWLQMIDQLTHWAGLQGVQNLSAEVREDGIELELLRRAGFALFARQEVWQLPHPAPPLLQPSLMQLCESHHDWDIELLYSHAVPALVRMVEPHPPSGRDSWVRYEGQTLMAYAHAQTGARGRWVRVYFRPEMKTDLTLLVGSIARHQPPAPNLPLYFSVRSYQEGLISALKKYGFQFVSSQAVMVKHTVQMALRPTLNVPAVVPANQIPAQSRPLHHEKNEPTTL